MPTACVIDTVVLRKANDPLAGPPHESSLFIQRLKLLARIAKGELIILVSAKLLQEYREQIREPRNETVKAFFELVAAGSERVVFNWKKQWSGADRAKARGCRYPKEDDHVLRTAIRPNGTTILTEEKRMLDADSCIYREFRVHIIEPW